MHIDADMKKNTYKMYLQLAQQSLHHHWYDHQKYKQQFGKTDRKGGPYGTVPYRTILYYHSDIFFIRRRAFSASCAY